MCIEFTRITIDPDVMQGKPCIRGMRVTVGMILKKIGSGCTIERILKEFPYLTKEDVLEAILYGGALASKDEIIFK